ncbi:phage baseplate protein [Anaerosolibacter sp.]|uniref:phage baseplate protein n=1 Tax=Anaerosolibacter sp. TaxID=1872527 RepID=UPI0039EF5B6A
MADTAFLMWQDPKSPTNIGGVEVDVLMEQEFTKEYEVPSHPTENGFIISDHVIAKPATISMIVSVGPSPVTWGSVLGSGFNRAEEVLSKLGTLADRKEPIKVVTNFKVYEPVIIVKLSAPQKQGSGSVIQFGLDLVRINMVDSQTVAIPPEYVKLLESAQRAGSSESKKGAAQTKDASDKNQDKVKKSLLKSGFDKLINL